LTHLERINIKHHTFDPETSSWEPLDKKVWKSFPQIFFSNGEPWAAANRYALDKFSSGNKKISTIVSNMNHLFAYARWLEESKEDWRDFPRRKKDRVIFKYRGFLIDQRDQKGLSPSTVSKRMEAVIRFYRWALHNEEIEKKSLWDDSLVTHKFVTTVGFERTLTALSSEAAIKNRKAQNNSVEGGLYPISVENTDTLISYLSVNKFEELSLMIMIGLFTGARSETIRTIRIQDLDMVRKDADQNIYYMRVGPGTSIKTKFDVEGEILIAESLLNRLTKYAYSPRRLKRQAISRDEDKTLLFITSKGNPYSESTFTKLISDLRRRMISDGLGQFHNFKFHQTRATFGTRLMGLALKYLPSQISALNFVKNAMLHRDASTTWKYVRFLELQPIKQQINDEFFKVFTGALTDINDFLV
jgi:integrase